MGRVIVGQDARAILAGKFTATLVELDDGKRIHVQLYSSDRGLFAKVTRMKWFGLVPAETLFEDDAVLSAFAEWGPQDISPDQRTAELLRRLTLITLNCPAVADVREAFRNLDRAGLYDNDFWSATPG